VAKMPKNNLPAQAYAQPHTMDGKKIGIPHTAGYPQENLDTKPAHRREKAGEPIVHIKARGAGAATKGINFRTTP